LNTPSNIEIALITTPLQIRASREIRETVFVIEQAVPREIEYDEYETIATHIIATLGGKPVGTARWRQTDHGQKLERFAVLPPARGKGVGGAMVKFILDLLDREDDVYLNSQVSAIKFYTNLGFKAIGDIFYEADIPHRKMILDKDQKK